jgi:hypothetical protein
MSEVGVCPKRKVVHHVVAPAWSLNLGGREFLSDAEEDTIVSIPMPFLSIRRCYIFRSKCFLGIEKRVRYLGLVLGAAVITERSFVELSFRGSNAVLVGLPNVNVLLCL